jgi:hypothetical protein
LRRRVSSVHVASTATDSYRPATDLGMQSTIPPLDLGRLRKSDTYHFIQWFWAQAKLVDRRQFDFYPGLIFYFMRNE